MSAPVGGAFALTNHFRQPVTDASFHGKYALLFFGFTHCKVVCPRALARISQALDLIGDLADEIQPLYITVDPERDSPEVMQAFLERTNPRFLGLTGDREHITAVKSTYKVYAERKDDPDAPDGYVVPHTAFSFLLDRKGAYLAHFVDAGNAQELAEKLKQLVLPERAG
ncbi:protein SCO1/2 [Paraburkholderia sp. BL23I1N1]|uniref:SCO family protein n=1 Tax=Paraburkholderia sp. BL23I1N1 TaxID=1938802 RepID=UPI000E71FFC3|nr:SCO family protein [Paraburkholderia sp. BL23I1N1]RKE36435.1 protein SCO1/2 [Paraburkholderia sp. BL23I1N1]